MNDEVFRVVVAQSMAETPGRQLSTLTDTGGSVAGGVSYHLMYASTVEIPPPPPLPWLLPLCKNLPVSLPNHPLPPILALRTPFPQRCSPGERPMIRSHSTSEKSGFYGRKWFEDHYGVKKHQWSSSIPPKVPEGYHL